MIYKNILISMLSIFTIGFAALATLSHQQHAPTLTANALIPDAFMEEVTTTIMDVQGKIKMKIVSPKTIHYADNDVTELTAPKLTLYRKSPTPWYINSAYAKATQGTENLIFWQNVSIHHAADENNPATLIQTSTLSVHPEQQTADTNALITLTQPSLMVKAIGMHADLNTGNIKLLSQARGEYVPNP